MFVTPTHTLTTACALLNENKQRTKTPYFYINRYRSNIQLWHLYSFNIKIGCLELGLGKYINPKIILYCLNFVPHVSVCRYVCSLLLCRLCIFIYELCRISTKHTQVVHECAIHKRRFCKSGFFMNNEKKEWKKRRKRNNNKFLVVLCFKMNINLCLEYVLWIVQICHYDVAIRFICKVILAKVDHFV